jgi:glycosyltransferase 2 family protein
MLGVLRRAGNSFIGVVGWRRLGLIVSAVIITVSLVVVYRFLKDLTLADILAATKKVELRNIAFMTLCIFGVFISLTAYDFFALRTIGKPHVPYRIAALSSLASFSIGHNIGAVMVTSAAIRYRIYSEWGLTATDVAKVCFITGLTFWLGNACLLGMATLLEPEAASAIDHFNPIINRSLAIASLGAVAAYLVWLGQKPRTIGKENWSLTLPSVEVTLLQIAIGVVDLVLCSLAMYFLLPSEPHIGFLWFVVVFVFATLLGFISHVPSGLGVFDAAMLVALDRFAASEVVASLLLFRLMYYVAPLLIALTLLGGREILLASRHAAKTR